MTLMLTKTQTRIQQSPVKQSRVDLNSGHLDPTENLQRFPQAIYHTILIYRTMNTRTSRDPTPSHSLLRFYSSTPIERILRSWFHSSPAI